MTRCFVIISWTCLYFCTIRGPTLSPVSALCFAWLPSQSGKVALFQQRQYTRLPLSSMSATLQKSTTFCADSCTLVFTRLRVQSSQNKSL